MGRNKYHRQWYLEHKDDPEYKRKRLVSKRKKYNLTPEEYESKFATQNGICTLCGKPFVGELGSKGRFAPVLDHNHKTGKTRDFVHRSCNTALGYLYDDPEICKRAAIYLERHQETQ